ncbi:MAG: elongation factor G [Rhizobiales bacterium]|nr:elongation factor G [Hyphomicrobiales bacterium]
MADKKGPAVNGAVNSNAGAGNKENNSRDISRKGPRAIALVGPFQSGKTTLLEAILARTGAIARAGSVDAGTSVGDAGAEARAHKMSVELNVASTEFLGETYHFIDCPGSVEFAHDMRAAIPAVDAAVVVCEADPKKIPQLQLVMRELEAQGIPRFLFINKIDKAERRLRETLAMLQPVSRIPLVLRQIPIWKDDIVAGFVDLALERAFIYHEHAASEVVDLEGDNASREKDARFTMLEKLADHDDELMEQLLEDIQPPRDKVFDDLSKELREGAICPVLIGSAAQQNGVIRLMKALRHETPGIEQTAARLKLPNGGEAIAHVVKTLHTAHGGKMSIARVLAGEIGEGTTVLSSSGETARVAGVFSIKGTSVEKRDPAKAGDIASLGKLDPVTTCDTITTGKVAVSLGSVPPYPPVLSLAISAAERKDDVKLGLALAKLADEDPSLSIVHNADLGEIVLFGQGEMHLRVAVERLRDRFGVKVLTHPPRVGYRETIRKQVSQRGRHRKQSGGHGQFGDVVLDVRPLPRGGGITFGDTIKGGVVPQQYVPSVETGVRAYLKCGPLGFPVVDVAVTLTDGSFHSVDSSDMAFQMAGRLAMSEAMPNCQPVLLEPIFEVEISCPNDATAKINAILSQRRGQILGFDARDGWDGWDVVRGTLPESAIGDLIVEVRSATAGVGGLVSRFDHLAELSGKQADQIVASRRAAE